MASGESRVETLRKRAAEARQFAEQARDEQAKLELMKLAELWERLAAHAREGSS